MTADASWNGNGSIVSEDDVAFNVPDAEDTGLADFNWFNDAGADAVDAEVTDISSRSRLKSDKPAPEDRDAKGGIPNVDEWMGFFSNVLIRLSTDWYIEYAFRGIDEDALSDREIERIHLAKEERDRIARPFAEYSNKSKFMRKHGRMIIASADSIDAALQLGMWFSRVNRIARKHRRLSGQPIRQRPQPTRAAPVFRPEPRQTIIIDDSEGNNDVSPEQGAPEGRGDHWRPPVGGPVFNPAGGG